VRRKNAGVILLAVFVSFFLSCSNQSSKEKPKQGSVQRKEAIDFTLTGLDSVERTLSAQKGSVVVVDFWATWCPPCKAEIPHLKNIYNSYKDQGLVMWGVGLDDEAKLRQFAGDFDINYPILVGTRSIGQQYDVQGIPTTFLFDKNNRIAFKHVGFAPGMEKDIEKEIKQLLNE